MALHDAFVLASSSANAISLNDMLTRYSERRVNECRNTLLLSRHLGRVRNRLPLAAATPTSAALGPATTAHVRNAKDFETAVRAAGLPTRTLPTYDDEFAAVWQFVDKVVPLVDRGFFLDRQEGGVFPAEGRDKARVLPSLVPVKCLNHVSIETRDVERLRVFYSQVLGLQQLDRPDFGFAGAWFRLSQDVALHIIERDPLKPGESNSGCPGAAGAFEPSKVPEKFIRRSFHTALTVENIQEAMQALEVHSIPYAINKVPGTSVSQVFFYDPDGNGVEIGDFDLKKS